MELPKIETCYKCGGVGKLMPIYLLWDHNDYIVQCSTCGFRTGQIFDLVEFNAQKRVIEIWNAVKLAMRECPFCGSENTEVCNSVGILNYVHYVICKDCGVRGPSFLQSDSKVSGVALKEECDKQAILKWNSRVK
jgi:Lar family restriction alleviation protein